MGPLLFHNGPGAAPSRREEGHEAEGERTDPAHGTRDARRTVAAAAVAPAAPSRVIRECLPTARTGT